MRIAICCGCLEPGRDGVGDYSRRLGSQLSTMGHQVMLIALKDRFPARNWLGGTQREIMPDGVAVLRLSDNYLSSERQNIAATELRAFAPDAISLQFVPYSFNDKGIAHDFPAFFEPLWKIAPCNHLMLHELWIGAKNVKDGLIAALQQFYLLQIIRRLKPQSVCVTNQVYQTRLSTAGVKNVEILPLFSNIPVFPSASGWLFTLLQYQGAVTKNTTRSQVLIGGMFGAIHPEWNPTAFLDELFESAKRQNKNVVIVSVGRKGAIGDSIWSRAKAKYQGITSCADLGEISAEQVSWFLQSVDFGMPTSPLELIGKSGSALAMLEHGVPLVVCRVPEIRLLESSLAASELDAAWKENQIHPYQPGVAHAVMDGLPRSTPRSRLPQVAKRFVQHLQEANASNLVMQQCRLAPVGVHRAQPNP